MYQKYWGLRESPFRSGRARRRFYNSPTHDEALSRLHFLVEQHYRMGLLVGPSGSGKSLLLNVFATNCSDAAIQSPSLICRM